MNHLHDLSQNDSFMQHYRSAIVQKAEVKNCVWWIQQLEQCCKKHSTEYCAILDQFKASGTWRDEYGSWRDACQFALGISQRMANKLILRYNEEKVGTGTATCLDEGIKSQAEDRAIRQVENSRDVPRETPQKSPPKPERNGAPEPKSQSAPVVDKTIRDKSGFQVPESLVPTWNRRDEIQSLMSAVSNIKCDLEKRRDDPLFPTRRFSYQSQLSALEQLHYQVSQCKPDVVCPECDGALTDKDGRPCGYCALTGFICQSEWHQKYEKSTTSFVIAKVAARKAECL